MQIHIGVKHGFKRKSIENIPILFLAFMRFSHRHLTVAYQELCAMREEIKAVEKLRKTAEQLEKDAQPKEKKRSEPER